MLNAVEDEVDDLDGGVDDAKALGQAREGVAEEFVVELKEDALPAGGVVDAFGAHADAGVEGLEGVGLFFQMVLVEKGEDLLHPLGDGVVGGEAVAAGGVAGGAGAVAGGIYAIAGGAGAIAGSGLAVVFGDESIAGSGLTVVRSGESVAGDAGGIAKGAEAIARGAGAIAGVLGPLPEVLWQLTQGNRIISH